MFALNRFQIPRIAALIVAGASVMAAGERDAGSTLRKAVEEYLRTAEFVADLERNVVVLQLLAQRAPRPAVAPEPPEPPQPFPVPKAMAVRPTGSFLGVNVMEVDSAKAKELSLKEERGVEITNVEEDSPAEKAGLKKGDVVLDYNGQRVEGTEQFVRLVRETPAGRGVKLGIWRNGSQLSISATTGTRKTKTSEWFFSGGDMPKFAYSVPDMPKAYWGLRSQMLGIDAEGVEGQLAQHFGVKEGVLVRSVNKGSAAEKAGLKAGDVITKVDGTEISSPRDLSSALRSAKGKKAYAFSVTRDRKETSVNVAFEEERYERGPARKVTRQEL